MKLTEKDARPVPGAAGPAFVRIPLRDRKGEVQAHTLVDEADLPRLVGYRWYCSKGGYAVRQETIGPKKQRTVLMARAILGLVPGDGMETDHVSRDKLDNRRSNLRVATHAENCQNRRRKRNDNIPRGVALTNDGRAKPWSAYGCKAGKQHHLGFFATMEDAAEVALSWRRENLPFATD